MADEADMAQAREEAREKSSKKRKTTSVEIPGDLTIDVEEDKKEEQPAAPTSKVEVSGSEEEVKGPVQPSGPVGGTSDGEAPAERVKPKTAKTTVCKVCGAEVKAQGIGAHMRRVHPELMEQQKSGAKSAPKEDEVEVKEAEGEGLVDFEKLKRNPVVLAAAAGVALLVGLVLVLIFVKPKEEKVVQGEVIHTQDAPMPNNIPMSPAEKLAMQEQEGNIIVDDTTGRRFRVVKDSRTGEYSASPIE